MHDADGNTGNPVTLRFNADKSIAEKLTEIPKAPGIHPTKKIGETIADFPDLLFFTHTALCEPVKNSPLRRP